MSINKRSESAKHIQNKWFRTTYDRFRIRIKIVTKKPSESKKNAYCTTKIHLTAPTGQELTHFVRFISGLQPAQEYFILFLCSSLTTAIVLSSKSTKTDSNRKTASGHCSMHFPQPLHLSESIAIKYSPLPSV
jgi:hypothetical protein